MLFSAALSRFAPDSWPTLCHPPSFSCSLRWPPRELVSVGRCSRPVSSLPGPTRFLPQDVFTENKRDEDNDPAGIPHWWGPQTTSAHRSTLAVEFSSANHAAVL